MDGDAVLGENVRVVNAMSEMVTATVSGLPFDGGPMEDLTRLELQLLVVGLIGLIDDLGTVTGEETVLACVRALARGAQRGPFRE